MLPSQVPSVQQLLPQLPLYSHKDKAATSKVLGPVLDRWAAGMLHAHMLLLILPTCRAIAHTPQPG